MNTCYFHRQQQSVLTLGIRVTTNSDGQITLLHLQCVALSRSLWPQSSSPLLEASARALVVLDVDGWKYKHWFNVKNTRTTAVVVAAVVVVVVVCCFCCYFPPRRHNK